MGGTGGYCRMARISGDEYRCVAGYSREHRGWYSWGVVGRMAIRHDGRVRHHGLQSLESLGCGGRCYCGTVDFETGAVIEMQWKMPRRSEAATGHCRCTCISCD